MGAGDHDGVALLDEKMGQGFGKGHGWDTGIPCGRGFDIVAGHGIAYDDEIRTRVQMPRVEPLILRDAPFLELGGHRWIDVLIGTCHVIAASFEHPGKATHTGATARDEMDVVGVSECHDDATPNVCITRSWTVGRRV